MRHRALALASGVALSACSTLSAPVLRHETGETLGPGHFRASARVESSRIFSLSPSSYGATNLPQKSDVFTGSLFGVHGAAGVFPKFDVEGSGFILQHGGGWKLGGKYEILRKGGLSLAGTLSYGASSGAGAVTYLTSSGQTDTAQILAANILELGVPVSFRFTPSLAIYSGLTYWHSEVSGVVATSYVLQPTNDLSMNLGLRMNFGMVEADVEFAVLRFYDPFGDSMRMLPYFGLAAGVVF